MLCPGFQLIFNSLTTSSVYVFNCYVVVLPVLQHLNGVNVIPPGEPGLRPCRCTEQEQAASGVPGWR